MKKFIAMVCLTLIPSALVADTDTQSISSFDAASKAPAVLSDSGGSTSHFGKAPIDFCARGKLLIFTGNCVLPKGAAFKDSISRKACDEVQSYLVSGLGVLYPYAKVYSYNDLEPGDITSKTFSPTVRGLFLIGEGDVKGGMVSGESGNAVYPSPMACGPFDIFGGFSSHSKYSPASPAPAALRRRMLARVEFLEGGANAPPGSWPRLCGPKVSLVYPTRTFAGRMKDDVKKLLGELMERKREQALGALEGICGACDQYVKAGYPLAKLCPPNSDVCALKRITPGSEELVMDNYCLALHPDYAPASR